jgi:hypothetical protein
MTEIDRRRAILLALSAPFTSYALEAAGQQAPGMNHKTLQSLKEVAHESRGQHLHAG